jgi:hypothetical protein
MAFFCCAHRALPRAASELRDHPWWKETPHDAQSGPAGAVFRVKGMRLIDPADRARAAEEAEGHLYYQVDDGPVIATPSPKLSFHELKPGEHKITVALAGNDHRPLGPQETVSVNIR